MSRLVIFFRERFFSESIMPGSYGNPLEPVSRSVLKVIMRQKFSKWTGVEK